MSATFTNVEQVVRGSREGCEINSIETGHHSAVRQDNYLYIAALVGKCYFQPNTPLGEHFRRLIWYDSYSTKVVAGDFFMPAAYYRGIGVEMPWLGRASEADW